VGIQFVTLQRYEIPPAENTSTAQGPGRGSVYYCIPTPERGNDKI